MPGYGHGAKVQQNGHPRKKNVTKSEYLLKNTQKRGFRACDGGTEAGSEKRPAGGRRASEEGRDESRPLKQKAREGDFSARRMGKSPRWGRELWGGCTRVHPYIAGNKGVVRHMPKAPRAGFYDQGGRRAGRKKKRRPRRAALMSHCASRWTRTNDPLINSQML